MRFVPRVVVGALTRGGGGQGYVGGGSGRAGAVRPGTGTGVQAGVRGYSGHEGDINEVINSRARARNEDWFARENREKLAKLRADYMRRRAAEVEHDHSEAIEALRALLDKHGVAHTGSLEGDLMQWKEKHF